MAFLKENPSGGEKWCAGGAKDPAGGVSDRVEGIELALTVPRGLAICEVGFGCGCHGYEKARRAGCWRVWVEDEDVGLSSEEPT